MIQTASHEALVASQFGPQAAAYVTSAVHARGEDLDRIAAVIDRVRPAKFLDLGCGGGHVGFAAAPFAGSVTAYDLSADMLAAVAGEATRRGLTNIVTRQGAAEALPFADASFDAVASRYSAHHWSDMAKGVAEAARVLKPGGFAVFADVVAPQDALLDTFLQSFELLRDPSHVRNRSIAEWRGLAEAAGLDVVSVVTGRLPLDFGAWIERMKTPPVFVTAIRALQDAMAARVRDYFDIRADGSFTIDTMVMEAQKKRG